MNIFESIFNRRSVRKYVMEPLEKPLLEKIQKMIRKGCTKEFILDLDYTEDEYAEAEARLFQMA